MFGSNSLRTWIEPKLVIWVLAVATPSCRAARPVICLKVEPGGYISEMTWLSIGFPGLLAIFCSAASFTSPENGEVLPAIRVGSMLEDVEQLAPPIADVRFEHECRAV